MHDIVDYEEAHFWIRDNEYLHTGHRVNFDSFTVTFKSLFMRHNETLNIWIHLLGMIVFFFVLGGLFVGFYHSSEILTKLKNEVQHSKIGLQLSKLTADLYNVISPETIADDSRKDQFFGKLSKLEEAHGYYIKALKQRFEAKELRFINFFEEKVNKLSSSLNRMIERFARDIENSQYNIKNIKNFVKNCFSEENFQHTIFYSFRGYLEYHPIILFIMCAIICLGCSTVFHWFHIMNPSVYKVLLKLDYAGICFLNFGSSYALYYYYFYCNPILFRIFGLSIFIACCTVFVVSMNDFMDKPENSRIKGLIYGGLGISNFVPILFILYLTYYSDEDSHFLPM